MQSSLHARTLRHRLCPARTARAGYPSVNQASRTLILKNLVHKLSTFQHSPMNPNPASRTEFRNQQQGQRVLSRRRAITVAATAATGLLCTPALLAAGDKRKVVVWSEGTANVDPVSKKVYPQDINTAIAEGLAPLEASGWQVVKASLNDPDQGISDELLGSTDVLIWWGHKRHGDVKDDLVNKIAARVRDGHMGFI